MKRKLIEYKIEVPAKLSNVKLLWRKFLKKDLHWQFALEVSYIEVRTSGVNLKLEEYLQKKGWKFTKRIYKNNTPITRKYQSCFDDIYHGYAMLAMTLPEVEFGETNSQDSYKVMERCIHLGFNNFAHRLGRESKVLWEILADRTYMDGYYGGRKGE
jgi:hypothetical protein